jgi:predicted metal-dependent hydrolase
LRIITAVSDDRFGRGIEEFNGGRYFECHDILEDLWHDTRGTDRLFLQGLIQVSVGFYHFLNSNFKGATSQFTRGLGKLDRYRPSHRGLELDRFTMEVVRWLAMAEGGLRGDAPAFDETEIPKLLPDGLHHFEKGESVAR